MFLDHELGGDLLGGTGDSAKVDSATIAASGSDIVILVL